MEDMELGHKLSATLPLIITEKLLIVMGEVYIGLRPSPIPPKIQVILVDCWIFMFMVMIEVDIGLIPATIIHITMVD